MDQATDKAISISDDLHLSIGAISVALSPLRGLEIAENLARKSFRRAMTEEADAISNRPKRGAE